MRCDEAAERITALVDGELPPAEREELERHLAACPACREARAAEEAVAARLRAAGRPPLPPGFTADVMRKVASAAPASGQPRGRVLPLWPLVAAFSAVAAAVVAMVVVGPGRTGAPRTMEVAEKSAPQGAAPPALHAKSAGEAGKAMGGPDSRVDAVEGERGAGAESGGLAKDEEKAGDKGVPPRDSREPSDAPPAADPGTVTRSRAPEGGGATPVPPERAAPRPSEEARKPAAKKEDAGRGPEEDRREGADAGALADEDSLRRGDHAKDAAHLLRAALFFEAKSLGEGQQAVEGALLGLVKQGYATREAAWKSAADLDTTAGRLRKVLERTTASNQAVPGFPEDRVLEVRVRRSELPRLHALLVQGPGLRQVPADAAARGAGSGEEARALLLELESLDRLGDTKEKALPPPAQPGAAAGPPPATTPPPAKAPAPAPAPAGPAEGGLAGGKAPPAEPVPPPMPSKEQLKRLEEAPPKAREGPTTADGEGTEVLVEIHVLVEPQGEGK